ncbi:Crotonobetainyl-CoA:carnitine CoA-transferase CaiB [Polaromonas sp. OV174]|uniref:CaiB/BaiF CoA transferase family protein n=1 Tax=Polaromonas sp. OV174 TaxID=1855300 RepID=UPI0008F2EEE9|nr:CoA transferase [Polaromonas sp. OV174]SFC03128.1 Crotonobetainyl-CoA:carnitine CoA-transferase CaiB [Polaromonas sp. OV174]
MNQISDLPLHGLLVVEFTHMVMGPSMGLILADLGAEVIKIEPLEGDNTRRLTGSGAGYFPMYNRNKASLAIDVKSAAGRDATLQLLDTADVVIENFRPGAMDALGLGFEAVSARNPKVIYCSGKGFLSGPYAHRTALDEVAQMMGGLAYMTGTPDRPMRAGASVIDVMGAMFGVIGIMAALEQRHRDGNGQKVTTALYETTAFLVGQHMAQFAVTGKAAPPMSQRQSAWAVYDVFEVKDHNKVFVAVVSDTQWRSFCKAFTLDELAADPSLHKNNDRVRQRERIMPIIRERLGSLTQAELMQKLEEIGLPFAPVAKPEDLFEDSQLNAGGLLTVTLPSGKNTKLPALPIEMGSRRMGVRRDLPSIGSGGAQALLAAGISPDQLQKMQDAGVLRIEDQ